MNAKSIFAAILIAATTAIGLFIYAKTQDKTAINLSGKWDIVFYFDESTFKPLVGQNTTNRMLFKQDNNIIRAEGELIQYNSQPLTQSEQIPFHFEGKIVDDKIEISYRQDGKEDENVGEINVSISLDGNKMNGTFTGKAAKSKGRISATRLTDK